MRDAGSDNGSRPLLHFQSELDNSSGTPTIINNSRHTWRFASYKYTGCSDMDL